MLSGIPAAPPAFHTNPMSNIQPNNMNPFQQPPMNSHLVNNNVPLVPLIPNNANFNHPSNVPPPSDPTIETGQSAMNILPLNTAPGWNDPPAFNKPSRTQVSILYYILPSI